MGPTQLIFPGFKFGKDDPALAERLVELGVGGFCLYGGEASEISSFIRRLQEKARVPLLFCADYENGTASHVRGGTLFPPNMALGAAAREVLAYQKGLITAVEAQALGVRWVLAPVLDLATRPDNPIVNVRAFGSDPELAARLGRAYILGLKSQGVLSCVKHFPGHGETRRDSHLTLPAVPVPRRQLLKRELLPFRRLMGLADSVMMAHVKVPGLGSPGPASLSRPVIKGLLRGRLRCRALVVSDALDMRAVSERYSEEYCARAALAAGVDVLLVPADPLRFARLLSALLKAHPHLAVSARRAADRLLRAKRACGLFQERAASEEDLGLVGSRRHRVEAEKMARAALTWVRQDPALVPLKGKVGYLEPGTPPAQWRGTSFLRELRRFEVRPTSDLSSQDTLVVGCFLRPRAYSGVIRYSEDQLRAARAAISRARRAAVVSFGSPFVFDQFKGYAAGLCAFCDGEDAQRAAAMAFKGLLEATGRMPVPLKTGPKSPRRDF